MLSKKTKEQLRIEGTYGGIKAIKSQLMRLRNSKYWDDLSRQKLNVTINDWEEYKNNMTDEMKMVPIIMIEVESVDDLVKFIQQY